LTDRFPEVAAPEHPRGWTAEPDDLAEYLEEQNEDPSFRAAFEDAQTRSSLFIQLVRQRHSRGLSQAIVAERMGTTQSAVSELEGGDTDPRLSTLQRYSRALGCRLHVFLEAGESARSPYEGPWKTVDDVHLIQITPSQNHPPSQRRSDYEQHESYQEPIALAS
jgi:transcriptional regulator with XRE-family HTH domain